MNETVDWTAMTDEEFLAMLGEFLPVVPPPSPPEPDGA